jgi:hypothetical protein
MFCCNKENPNFPAPASSISQSRQSKKKISHMHFTNHNTAKFLSALSFTNHNTAKWHSCSTKPPSLHNSDLTPRYELRLFSISLRLCFDHLTLSFSLPLSPEDRGRSLSHTPGLPHRTRASRESRKSLFLSIFFLLCSDFGR